MCLKIENDNSKIKLVQVVFVCYNVLSNCKCSTKSNWFIDGTPFTSMDCIIIYLRRLPSTKCIEGVACFL